MHQNQNNKAVFLSAPHRVMFFTGSFQLIAVILFWLSELIGRYTALWPPLTITVNSTWTHAFFMLYGLFTFFLFGFLMTTYPRWLDTPAITARRYLSCFFLMSAGILIIYTGLFLSRLLVLTGVFLFLCGWAVGLCALLNVYFRAGKKPVIYETVLSAVMTLGLLFGACGLLWLLTYHDWFFRIMLTGGIWLFLLPALIVVCHRMIPFFSHSVLENYTMYRPAWSLPTIGVCLLGHAVLELTDLLRWSFLFDLSLAASTLYLSCRWGLLRSFKVPLLAVLHIAFLWLSIAMLLFGIQSLVLFLSGELVLGKSPLHAIGIGFVASMILAMTTRVSLGHSGRALKASKTTLLCFCFIQFAAVSRLLGAIPLLSGPGANYLNLAAAIIWIFSFGIWASIYMPIYLRPRLDGKPG